MTFLAAAFLAGFAVLAVPFWLHRMNERAPAQTTVSSLMLMREAEEPVRTRRTLAHRVLLALRLALLTLLALAFAKPVLETTVDAQTGGGVAVARLIVLDSSLSMRRHGAWAEALAVAETLRGSTEDRIVLASDRLTFVDDLRSVSPGWSRLDFGGLPGRLDAAIAGLPQAPGGWQIHLISDFQASAAAANFNALVAGTRWPVQLHTVGGAADNWAVESVVVNDRRLEAVVASFAGASRNLPVTVSRADGDQEQRATVQVAAGSRSGIGFDIAAAGPKHEAWRVALSTDDALADDDVGVAVRSAADAATVAILAPDAARSTLAFLVAALDASGFADPLVLQAGSPWPRSPDAVILLDPGDLAEPLRRRVDRHLATGGGALVIVGPRTERYGALPFAGGEGTSVGSDARPVLNRASAAAYRVVAADKSHPLAQGAWHDVEVERALKLAATGDETILALAAAEGSTSNEGAAPPLLVEKRFGKGRALVLLTALDRNWSSLVLRPAFVGMIGNAVRYLGQDSYPMAYAGEPVHAPAASMQIFDAAGRRVLALDETARQPVIRLERPGVYAVRTPGRETLMAVNVDPRESDLRPLDADLLARWQNAAAARPARSPNASSEADAEVQLPLAPWLLALAAALLIVESMAANMGRWNPSPPWRKESTA